MPAGPVLQIVGPAPWVVSFPEGSLSFEDRGSHELKGVSGVWRLYSIA